MLREWDILIEKIVETIESSKNVVCIQEYEKDVWFEKKEYNYIVKCQLLVEKATIDVIIGIPNDWEIDLIDIYIRDRGFPFIPHMEKNGKLCLFDLEGCLIDSDLEGILIQCINRAVHLIYAGLNKRNVTDFINEFEYYWNEQNGIEVMKVIHPKTKKITLMKYMNKSNEKFVNIAFETTEQLQGYDEKVSQCRNCIYYPVVSSDFIYPPDPREPLSVQYVADILLLGNKKELSRLLLKIKREQIIIIEIKQPNGTYNSIGVKLSGAKWEAGELLSCAKISPIYISRIEKEYLIGRVKDDLLINKKILLIGCGSIGGYISDSLVKSGIEDLTIVDDDRLREENIFRHTLGMQYVGMYKSVALAKHYKGNIPNLSIKTLESKIQSAILEEEIDISAYDIIISATGNHNVNLWLNKYIYEMKIDIPVIYAWNEVCGIGNHVAFINRNKKGCYQCFFDRLPENGELYDRNAYCEPGQQIVNIDASCGHSYVPYGVVVSQKTAAMCMDIVIKYFRGNLEKNMILSLKGDKEYFESRGMKLSPKYYNQIQQQVSYIGEEFVNEQCTLCGK